MIADRHALRIEHADEYIESVLPSAVVKKTTDQFLTYQAFRELYRFKPAQFAEDCVDWDRMRDRPAPYQLQVLDDVVRYGKEAVRGPRGLGKTLAASIVVNWFALTRDGDIARDWKIVTTAGSATQLNAFLWPGIRRMSRLLRWNVIGRPPYIDGAEMLVQSIKLSTGEAISVSPREPELAEGAHAHSILYIFDEAKSIADGVYNSSEGAFSGAGKDTDKEAYALAISTPGKPTGRFFFIHSRKPGFEDWHVKHVTLIEAIAAKRISGDWASRMRRQWGESSQLYQNHVLGEFATGTTNSVIPLAWLEAANDRWRAMHEAGTLPVCRRWSDEERAANEDRRRNGQENVPVEQLLTSIGVDVAYGGDDKATLAERAGDVITMLHGVVVHKDHMPTKVIAAKAMEIHRLRGGLPVVDVVGVGGGVVDDLRATEFTPGHRFPVLPFSAGAKAARDGVPLRDRSGVLRFPNLRSAAWWYLRELLDPANDSTIAIPPDDLIPALRDTDSSLMAELLAPTWDINGELIVVESKDELRKPERLGHSTDWADAVVQAYGYQLCGRVRTDPTDLGMS